MEQSQNFLDKMPNIAVNNISGKIENETDKIKNETDKILTKQVEKQALSEVYKFINSHSLP